MSLRAAASQRLWDHLRAQESRLPAAVRVRAIRIVDHADGQARQVDIEADLDVTPLGHEPTQQWLFTLDFTEDAEQLLDGGPNGEDLRTASLIVTANIAEWWHTKDAEPATAALARRVS
ncbi:hypothetical protein OG785_05815 [Streptomyces sp. NBC_00006]|uniref:hypothetical protein n=1 Tax=Streptomyces sp. NBC_00006 TaxID=2975619 RepID=UPI002251C9EC|nr:hypothetical protein [Streptomyces sp. NBC_00006]MCX5530072.1 hypothetical protein [Streptomyces sp. NBC_00006]